MTRKIFCPDPVCYLCNVQVELKSSSSKYNGLSLRNKCPYSELFWSTFSRIRTEYGEILRISCGKMRTRITLNTDTFYPVCFAGF